MKKITILFLIFMTFNSYSAGGISGGGGNLISPLMPEREQTPEEIINIIKKSNFLLKTFIAKKYELYAKNKMSKDEKRLFDNLFADKEKNIYELMEITSLDFLLDGPCRDNKGNIFDGSTYVLNPHSVCISAFTIAMKCDKSEVPKQGQALILHELSEVAGLSDNDAILLQKQFLNETK